MNELTKDIIRTADSFVKTSLIMFYMFFISCDIKGDIVFFAIIRRSLAVPMPGLKSESRAIQQSKRAAVLFYSEVFPAVVSSCCFKDVASDHRCCVVKSLFVQGVITDFLYKLINRFKAFYVWSSQVIGWSFIDGNDMAEPFKTFSLISYKQKMYSCT